MQDEARELLVSQPQNPSQASSHAESALDWLTQRCDVAVVTLGERGCIVKQRGQEGILQEPAAAGVKAEDATGAATPAHSILLLVLSCET